MPISGIGTYIPTMQEFEAHWTACNALGAAKLLLAGNFNLVGFQSLITSVDAGITDSVNKQNLQTNAAGDRDIQRAAMRERIRQFRAAGTSNFPGSRYIRSLPRLPHPGAASGPYLTALDDMGNLWTAINTNVPPYTGFVPPLLLAGGYAVAGFTTDLAALRTAYNGFQTAAQNAQQSRASRDLLFATARERMRQYRQGAVMFLPTGHALLLTIPALTPPPGSTPAAANLSGAWNPGISQADLTWTHPNVAQVEHWEIRYHPGPIYKASEEQAVTGGNLPVGTLSFSTAFGLVASGSVSWFKVYAVTAAGNEKGSNAVKIVRP